MGTTFERDDSDAVVDDWLSSEVGRSARFEEFFKEYQPVLYRFAVSRNAIDPEGVVHLALLDGFGALERMRSRDVRSVRAYLFRAVSSHIAMEHRRRPDEQFGVGDAAADADGFEDRVVSGLEFDRALDLLPKEQRAVIRMRFADDLSTEEIGRILGKTANAVRQLQLRGVRRLRRLGFTAVLLLILLGAAALLWRWAAPQHSLIQPAEQQEPVADEEPTADREFGDGDEPRAGDERSSGPVAPDAATEVVSAEGPALLDLRPDVETSPEQADGPPLATTSTVPSEPPVAAQAVVYEGFDLSITGADIADNPSVSSYGFALQTTWGITRGDGTAVHDPVGLQYVDADGQSLVTSPGAARFSAIEPGTHLARPLLSSPGDTYWVAYLLRQDSEGYGDAYWSPDGHLDRSAVGIQQFGQLRYVNGPVTDTAFAVGETYLLVVRVEGKTSSLWVNPTLGELGPPDAIYAHEQMAIPDRLILVTNELGEGAYTFDEVRLGASFEAVAPRR